jgi:hypothetical protein
MSLTSRADLHCRSSANAPPTAVYALAKERGMDFVTIADRDSIDGVLEIADRPDVFMSVELTARERHRDRDEPLRLLCYGVSRFDHDWLQRRRHDADVCKAYLHEHEIAHEIAHPPELHEGGTVGHGYTETARAETPWEFLTLVRQSAILDDPCGQAHSSPGYCSFWQGALPQARPPLPPPPTAPRPGGR